MSINRLWITEKPEMARSLAAGLVLTYGTQVVNSATARNDGCIKLANGDAVGHFFGHMLELAPPEHYLTEDQNRGNAFDYLPLMPAVFKKLPKPETDRDPKGGRSKPKLDKAGQPIPSFQLTRMVQLAKAAREIVNAGDTDREGQLIVDEFLEYAQIDPHGRSKPVWRLALQDPKEEKIRALVQAGLEKNSDPKWSRRSAAASIRERGDWAIGMTASRAYRQVTGFIRMSAGRVVTPTLSLVVERELAIERFKPVQYFVPVITLGDGTRLRWFRREGAAGREGFDSEGRIVSEAVARMIVSSVLGRSQGRITLAKAERHHQPPPLPFDLGTLQSTAARRYGMTLKEVSQAAQKLYESHKMISYIGTDCRFLPTSMLADAQDTVNALARMYGQEARGTNLELRSKAWNDAKTDEHFAIVPTGRIGSGLTQNETNVFKTVAQRYMAQFYPDHEFARMNLEAAWGVDEFKAVEKEVTRAGWKACEYDAEDEDTADAEGEASESEAQASREQQTQGGRK